MSHMTSLPDAVARITKQDAKPTASANKIERLARTKVQRDKGLRKTVRQLAIPKRSSTRGD